MMISARSQILRLRPNIACRTLPRLASLTASLERTRPARRTIFSLSRLPIKTEYQKSTGKIKELQQVRIKKAKPKLKTILWSCVAIYLAFGIYDHYVIEPLFRGLSDILADVPEEELNQIDDTPLFIPFPGTTIEHKPKPYKGSDPEWQEFIKFSKDHNLAKRVKEELAGIVRDAASRHHILSMRLGKDMKLRRFWLDVDFPPYAPPTFERSGLVIGERIYWGKQPVDANTALRIQHLMWPSALMQSTWSFAKVMVGDEMKKLARIFGMEQPKPSLNIDELLSRQQQLMRPPQLATKDNPTAQPTTVEPGKTIPSPSGKSTMGGKENDVQAPDHLAFQTHFMRPILAFRQKFAQTWRPHRYYPPSGSILVSGMVELDTPKAWLVMDVIGAWDPKTKTYDYRSLQMKLRRWQPKRQGPIGGT